MVTNDSPARTTAKGGDPTAEPTGSALLPRQKEPQGKVLRVSYPKKLRAELREIEAAAAQISESQAEGLRELLRLGLAAHRKPPFQPDPVAHTTSTSAEQPFTAPGSSWSEWTEDDNL